MARGDDTVPLSACPVAAASIQEPVEVVIDVCVVPVVALVVTTFVGVEVSAPAYDMPSTLIVPTVDVREAIRAFVPAVGFPKK